MRDKNFKTFIIPFIFFTTISAPRPKRLEFQLNDCVLACLKWREISLIGLIDEYTGIKKY